MSPVLAGWLPASLRSAHRATQTARILELEIPGWTGSVAGQHVDLRLTAEDGYQAARSYSLASHGDEAVELAVVEIADGEVSPYLVETMQPGDQLEVRGPIGGYFVWRDENPGPVQLIGGGSGVVPLVAIARAHAAAPSTATMRLLYSVRSPDDALYLDELTGLRSEHFAVDVVYTRIAPLGWERSPRRLDATDLATHTIPPERHPTNYICGPTAFVEAVADELVGAGHPATAIRTERFGGA